MVFLLYSVAILAAFVAVAVAAIKDAHLARLGKGR
jgi:hypothetical protein